MDDEEFFEDEPQELHLGHVSTITEVPNKRRGWKPPKGLQVRMGFHTPAMAYTTEDERDAV